MIRRLWAWLWRSADAVPPAVEVKEVSLGRIFGRIYRMFEVRGCDSPVCAPGVPQMGDAHPHYPERIVVGIDGDRLRSGWLITVEYRERPPTVCLAANAVAIRDGMAYWKPGNEPRGA